MYTIYILDNSFTELVSCNLDIYVSRRTTCVIFISFYYSNFYTHMFYSCEALIVKKMN